jgi:hypothetical protein
MLHSSLHLAKAASSCKEGVLRTRVNLHHIHAGIEEFLFSLSDLLEFSGLDDAVWALRAVPQSESWEAEWVGRNFAADCVERALEQLPTGAMDQALVVDTVKVARRFADGSAVSGELADVWRKLLLPTRAGKIGLLLRGAKACVFPCSVSEAARLSSVCSARASLDEELFARKWQAARLRQLLIGVNVGAIAGWREDEAPEGC